VLGAPIAAPPGGGRGLVVALEVEQLVLDAVAAVDEMRFTTGKTAIVQAVSYVLVVGKRTRMGIFLAAVGAISCRTLRCSGA